MNNNHSEKVKSALQQLTDSEKYREIQSKISERLDPHLQPGKTYYAAPVSTSFGCIGGSLFEIIDGEEAKVEDEALKNAFKNLPYGSKLLDILSFFPPRTKVLFTFRKGEPFKTEPQDAAGLLRSFREKQENCPWCRQFWKEHLSRRHAEGLITFYLEDNFLELDKDWTEFLPEKPRKKARLAGGDELECLYYALDEKLGKLRVVIKEGEISMESEPPFPEFGLVALSLEEEVADVAPEDIRGIFEYLESGSDGKIAKALAAAKQNADTLAAVEERYLNLVRARLNDPEASIDDFGKAALNKGDVNTLLGDAISETFISYSYMKDYQTKLIVDFIGAMIRNRRSIDSFYDEAREFQDERELQAHLQGYAHFDREGIRKSLEIYPDGWYGKICSRLLDMKLEKVLFEKTGFGTANGALFQGEYMYFLNMVSADTLYFDIHQSDCPELTGMFWLMNQVPATNWSDVSPEFPPCILSFDRDGTVKTGDFDEWDFIRDGFPSYRAHGAFKKGCDYYDEEEHEKAAACFSESLEEGEHKRHRDARKYRAECWFHLDEYEKALQDFDLIEEGEKENARYYTYKGVCHERLNNDQAALECFTRAVELNPTVLHYENRALAHIRMERYEDAVADYTAAMEYADNPAMLLMQRGSTYKKMGDMKKTWMDLHRAIEEDPACLPVYLDTLEMYCTMSMYDEGFAYITRYEEAILKNGSERDELIFLYLKASIYLCLGKNIGDFRPRIEELAAKDLDLRWYFGHSRKWLEEADLKDEVKEEIRRLTDLIEY